MKGISVAALAIMVATSAHADTILRCKGDGDDCMIIGRCKGGGENGCTRVSPPEHFGFPREQHVQNYREPSGRYDEEQPGIYEEQPGIYEVHPPGRCCEEGYSGLGPIGTFKHPIEDVMDCCAPGPIHRGMYCVHGLWHHGWLQYWERSPVIKPSCGNAVYQMPL